MVTIAVVKEASEFLKDLGIPYRNTVSCSNTVLCKVKRDDAPTLMGMLKDAGFKARY